MEVCYTFSHLHLLITSSHLIFASHLHIFSPSPSHHIFSSHLHISSSHLIFTSSHLHILHLRIFASSHLLISSSHLHISSHLTSFTSSLALLCSCPLAFLLSCPLALLPPCPLAFLLSCSLALLPSCLLALFSLLLSYFSLKAGGVNEAPRNATLSHERRFDRQKLQKNCDFDRSVATFSHEMKFDRQKLRKTATLTGPVNLFRTNLWVTSICVKSVFV